LLPGDARLDRDVHVLGTDLDDPIEARQVEMTLFSLTGR
jgi:hypothetical protein